MASRSAQATARNELRVARAAGRLDDFRRPFHIVARGDRLGGLAPPALLRRRLPLRHAILICTADSDVNACLLERAASRPLRAGGAIERHRLRGISDWTSRLMSA